MVILSDGSVRGLVPVVQELLGGLGLRLDLAMSRVVRAKDGFDFLGFRFVRKPSERHGGKRMTWFFPSPRSVKRVKGNVRDRCGRLMLHVQPKEVVQGLNRLLVGWREYFRHSNASRAFMRVQWLVLQRSRRFLRRRETTARSGRYRDCPDEFLFERLGLVRLVYQGSVRYAQPRGAA